MKLYEAATIITISIIIIACGYAVVQKIKPGIIPQDNFAEELLEESLDQQGFGDIDLTPDSKE